MARFADPVFQRNSPHPPGPLAQAGPASSRWIWGARPGRSPYSIRKTAGRMHLLFGLGILFSLLVAGGAGAEPIPEPFLSSPDKPAASISKNAPAESFRLAYIDLECDFCRRFVFALHEEAFRRLGLSVAFLELPGKRALIQSNAGELDGEALRIADFDAENQFANLIPVPEPLLEIPIVAYAAGPSPSIRGWESLREGNFLVAGPARIKWIQTRLAHWVGAERTIPAQNPSHAARLLLSNRAGIVVSIPALMAETLSPPALGGRGIRPAGLLETIETFAFLHIRHKRLAPRLARAIQEMKADGTLAEIKKEALSRLPNPGVLSPQNRPRSFPHDR